MTENKKNLIMIVSLTLVMVFVMLINTGEMEEYQKLYPPIEETSATTQVTENLRVDDTNAGPMDFDAAENYCKMKGMSLPTREQAWEMWLASSNCKIDMVLNKSVIKDKATFYKSCNQSKDDCFTKAENVDYSCNADVDLLFLDDKTYRRGNYWLKDKYGKNGHYTVNFITGRTDIYPDSMKLLGVRCVSSTKH